MVKGLHTRGRERQTSLKGTTHPQDLIASSSHFKRAQVCLIFPFPLYMETCKQGELGQQLWAAEGSGREQGPAGLAWPGCCQTGRALCCCLLEIKQQIQPWRIYGFIPLGTSWPGTCLPWRIFCQVSFACCQGFVAIPESCPASLGDLTLGICCAHGVLSLWNKEDTLNSHRRKPKTCNPKGCKSRKKAKITQCLLFLGYWEFYEPSHSWMSDSWYLKAWGCQTYNYLLLENQRETAIFINLKLQNRSQSLLAPRASFWSRLF